MCDVAGGVNAEGGHNLWINILCTHLSNIDESNFIVVFHPGYVLNASIGIDDFDLRSDYEFQ